MVISDEYYLSYHTKIYLNTVKAVINAHALINAHPPIWTLKIGIFGAFFGKILASYKRPSENMGWRKQIFSSIVSYQMYI